MKAKFIQALSIVIIFIFMVVLLEAGSYAIYRYAMPLDIKELVDFAVYPESHLKELRWLPNSLWHHELPGSIVNDHGTIGPDFETPKPSDVYRIICLGDSTTQFPGHHAEILQEKLNGQLYQGKRLEVINAGIGGHVSAFTLSYFALRLIHYEPDMIILKSGYNDYLPFTFKELEYDYLPAFKQPYTIDVRDQKYWGLARHGYLLRLLGSIFLDLPGKDFYALPTMWWAGKSDLMANSDKLFLYTENVKSIVSMSQARGIKVLMLDLPVAPPEVPGYSEYGYRDFVKYMDLELKKVVTELGVDYIETKTVLHAEDFADHVHLKRSGGEKIARLIIEKYGFLTSP